MAITLYMIIILLQKETHVAMRGVFENTRMSCLKQTKSHYNSQIDTKLFTMFRRLITTIKVITAQAKTVTYTIH